MIKYTTTLLLLVGGCFIGLANNYETLTKDFVRGDAKIQSMSVLAFGPEGILFVGDSKAGQLVALDLGDRKKNDSKEGFGLKDVETLVGSAIGVGPKEVIIHDMAVNPISQNVYLAVSRSNALEIGFWKRPNDLNYATILLRIKPDETIEEVALNDISHSKMEVPKVIAEGKESWRKSDFRTDAITDISYDDGKLYVAGLSNEEFASALRVLDFPFKDKATHTTIEVYHVAHAKSETEAPIRTLLPYTIDGRKFILAAYTCTPFVSIPVDDIKDGEHVVSKTLGEFGFGNMPIDIISFKGKAGDDYLLMSNTAKAMIRINPEDIKAQKEGLTKPLEPGQYAVGLKHDVLSAVGVTQIDNLNDDHVLILQRMPNGELSLRSYPKKYLG